MPCRSVSGCPVAPKAPCNLLPAPQAPDTLPPEQGGPPSAARRASCGLGVSASADGARACEHKAAHGHGDSS